MAFHAFHEQVCSMGYIQNPDRMVIGECGCTIWSSPSSASPIWIARSITWWFHCLLAWVGLGGMLCWSDPAAAVVGEPPAATVWNQINLERELPSAYWAAGPSSSAGTSCTDFLLLLLLPACACLNARSFLVLFSCACMSDAAHARVQGPARAWCLHWLCPYLFNELHVLV